MKKIILILSLVTSMILMSPIEVMCKEYEFGENEALELYPSTEMEGLIEAMPDGVKAEMEEYSTASDDTERLDAVKEKLDFGYWVKYIVKTAADMIFPAFSGCSALLGTVIIISLIKKIVFDGGVSELCEYVISLTVAVISGNLVFQSIRVAEQFVGQICSVMNAMIPVMSAVMLSSGSLTAASVNSSALMLYITVTENITSSVLIPLAGILFALSCVSVVFKGVNISAFISALRRLIMTLLGFSLMIFSFVLGIQTSLAQSADSLTMKTVRFAVGSYIPIVGGAVSEALTTVTAALSRIRHIAGSVGIVIILLMVLPTLISLFLSRLSLLICKSAAETLDCGSASGIIADADSILSLFLAFSAMTGVFFIFAAVLFMNSGLS